MTRRPKNIHAPQSHGSPADSAPSRRWIFLAAAVIVAAGVAAYWNSFAGQCVFDDPSSIRENPSITHLGDLRKVLCPPRLSSVTGRPLVNLSLAVNYAIGGTVDRWSYHAFNLAFHLLAALTLMGIVRRTLTSPALRGRFGRAALPLATAISLLWALHPLQVQAVTYIIQRAESLASLMYLLTLYCTIRSAGPGATRATWTAAAILSCAAGMATKEMMATAPVAVLVYDRLFLAGGWRQAISRRKFLYAGLAATWLILAALMWSGPRSNTTGFGLKGVTPWGYAGTEFGVILYYLRLVFWPSPLVGDYYWPWANSVAGILPPALAVGAMLAATIWLLWRGRPAAMAGVWFFLILAPTSSFVPIIDPVFEHRMYLPLAAVVCAAVLGGYRLLVILGRHGPAADTPACAGLLGGAAAVAALAVTLGWLTHQRNRVYASEIVFWQDVVDKQPNNWRGPFSLGNAFLAAGNLDQANNYFQASQKIAHSSIQYRSSGYDIALVMFRKDQYLQADQELTRLLSATPPDADVLTLKGNLAMKQDKPAEAANDYARALQKDPNHVEALAGLADAYLAAGKTAEAKQALAKTQPLFKDPPTAATIARLYERMGDRDAGIAVLRQAIPRRLPAQDVPAVTILGTFYAKVGNFPKAAECFTRAAAAATQPADQDIANRELGLAYTSMGQYVQAERAYQAALKADANDALVLNNLAYLYANKLNAIDKASPYAAKAAHLEPNNPTFLYTYGCILAETGDYAAAEGPLTRARQLYTSPASIARVDYRLGQICEQTHRPREAVRHYRQGLEALQGQQDPGAPDLRQELTDALDRVQNKKGPK
jgi:tetratricopeptide (TPR) repeat protein